MFFIYPIYLHLLDSKKTGKRSSLKIKGSNLKMYVVLLSVFLVFKKQNLKNLRKQENTFVYFVQQKVCSFKHFCVFKNIATKVL